MRTIFTLLAAAALAGAAASASAAVQCDTLKSAIAAKIDAKGVKGYLLDIVATGDEAGKGSIVGSCEAGSKKIVYQRVPKT